MSKIVHILISLPTPSQKIMLKINRMLYDFLWDGKPDKLKRIIAKQKIDNGGINMIDITLFEKALKITWIRRLILGRQKWKTLATTLYPELNEIQNYGNHFLISLYKNMSNPFWSNVITCLHEFQSKICIGTMETLKATSFLFNDKFKINNSVIQNKVFIKNKLFFVHQLMDDNCFLNFEEFNLKYNVEIDYLSYYSILRCIKTSSNFNELEITNQNFLCQPAFATII